jgi:hypothetical protein
MQLDSELADHQLEFPQLQSSFKSSFSASAGMAGIE